MFKIELGKLQKYTHTLQICLVCEFGKNVTIK